MLELKNRPLSNYDLTTTQSSNLSLVPNYNSHQAKMDMLIEKFKNLNINEPSREINLKKTDPIRSLLNQQIYEIFHILLFNCKGIPLKETKAICLTSQYYATFLSNNLLKIKLDTYQVLDSINPNICPKNLYKLYCSNYVLSSKEINDLYTWTKLYRATTLIENIDLFPTNNIQNYIPSQIDAYNKKGYKNILNTSYEEYQTIGLINDFFKLIYFTDDILFDHTFINPHKITLENLPILLESIITKCSKFAEIIENLNIQSEIFYEIPSGIEIFGNLKSIQIIKCPIQELPDSLFKLTELESLILAENNLTLISNKISQLQSLLKLHISYNPLKQLPHSITKLRQLKILRIENCQMDRLPKNLYRLAYLYELSFINNNLDVIPKKISYLLGLKILKFNDNCITNSQLSKILTINSLTILSLKNNKISQINSNIKNLVNLEELNLSENNIKVIPPEIEDLKLLEHLILRKNNLNDIIEEIFNLRKLRTLDVSDNSITKLSSNIYKLKKLRRLDISNNQLTEIPSSLTFMPKIKKILLKGNLLNTDSSIFNLFPNK